MGCDTKGFVVTDNIDAREITIRLTKLIRSIQGTPINSFVKNSNCFIRPEWEAEWNYITFDFKDGEDQRRLMVFFDTPDFEECHGDIGKRGIVLILGMWGNSLELMKKMLDVLQDMGECYIQENDCGDDPILYKN